MPNDSGGKEEEREREGRVGMGRGKEGKGGGMREGTWVRGVKCTGGKRGGRDEREK